MWWRINNQRHDGDDDVIDDDSGVVMLFMMMMRMHEDHTAHVAGAWTERQKMFHGGSFLKLADGNKYIKNPEAQNREVRGF